MKSLHAACLFAATAIAAPPAVAQGDTITGEILRYECGDNCYLVILTEDGVELTGLCIAADCQPWNEAAAMPSELIGATVRVWVGMADQTDAEGNVMGQIEAFETLEVLN